MQNSDTILIKIGVSYKENITAEELYLSTSISWKIGGSRLESGDYKYYCSVYDNKIKEVYELTGYEEDARPDKEGRYILKGKIADESVRSKLLELDVGELHKGKGNPIKYTSLEKLLELAKGNDIEAMHPAMKSIFQTKEIADWFFDLVHDTAKKLDISGCHDERLSITFRNDKNGIHLNYCNWIILGIYQDNKDNVIVRLPVFENYIETLDKRVYQEYSPFSQESGENQVVTCLFELSSLNKMDEKFWDKYNQVLAYIVERFKGYNKSRYRNKHNNELCQAIFDRGFRTELLKNGLSTKTMEGRDLEGLVEFPNDKKLIDHIHHYINTKGFHYTKDQLNNFYLSLKTKPFVILSGISGTGKTKIVQLFAESIGATEDNGQFRLIPVRPDWSDGSDLIGFEDIKGDFQAGPLTEVLIEANKPENREKPYFVLLDEMNLARVEYYFSDLLSVMESREVRDGEFISSPVVDREEVGQLLLRENLYIIGTVNMDETTHPFSSKVLDRANTIEFNDVSLDHFGFLSQEPLANAVTIRNDQLAGRYLTLKDAFSENETLIREVTDWLVEINRILERTKSHFAYRVRDEVCFYMIYNEQANLMTREKAFDYQFHQKILPRLIGNDIKTENVLKDLFQFCTNHEYKEQEVTLPIEEARFPMSAEKLSEMIRKIQYDGFTSFWG